MSAFTGNPMWLGLAVRGLGTKAAGSIIKGINSPDANIARMFKNVEKLRAIPTRTQAIPAVAPKSPTPIPVTRGQSTSVGTKQGKTAIKRRSGLTGNKGEVSIGGKPQDFATAEGQSIFHEKGDVGLINTRVDASGLNVSTDKDLALGQSGKGVLFEFDRDKILGKRGVMRPIKKPGTDFVGQKEFEILGGEISPSAIKSVTIRSGTKISDMHNRLLKRLVKEGDFVSETLENGDVVLTPKNRKSAEFNAAKGKTPILKKKSTPIKKKEN
jgi:hypothetical protein